MMDQETVQIPQNITVKMHEMNAIAFARHSFDFLLQNSINSSLPV